LLHTVTHFSLALILLISRSALNSTQFVMHISNNLTYFSSNKEARHNLEKVQATLRAGHRPLRLLRPCDTRWSSRLRTVERMYLLKSCVQALCEQDASFWENTGVLITFLKTFQIATDVVQSDASCLMDVYQQFLFMITVVNELPATHLIAPGKAEVLSIIQNHWHKHVTVSALISCAILSLDITYKVIWKTDTEALQQQLSWFLNWGSHYLHYYKLSEQNTRQDIENVLLEQWLALKAMKRPFVDLMMWKDKVQSRQLAKSAAKSDNHGL
jgi:hypothetical protein